MTKSCTSSRSSLSSFYADLALAFDFFFFFGFSKELDDEELDCDYDYDYIQSFYSVLETS